MLEVPKKQVLHLELTLCSEEEVIGHFASSLTEDADCATSSCKSIMFANLHALSLARENEEFCAALNSADLLLNDGIGIEIIAKRCGVELKENLNGTDLIPKLFQSCTEQSQELSNEDVQPLSSASVFLLGSKSDIVAAAARECERRFKGLSVAGFHDGYFSAEENNNIVDLINQSGAKVLVLGMGMPLQELWISENRNKLSSVRVVIAGGAIIDYLSGCVKRSPAIFVRLRLEWLYRLFREPKRLIGRNVRGVIDLIRFSRCCRR